MFLEKSYVLYYAQTKSDLVSKFRNIIQVDDKKKKDENLILLNYFLGTDLRYGYKIWKPNC